MRSLTLLISCTAADLLCHTNHFYYLYVATVSTFLCFFMQIMFPLLLFLQYVTQIITLSTFRAKKNGGREAQLVILSHYRGTPNTFTTSKPRPAAKGYKIAFEKSMLCSFDQHHQL